jgi:hypothetical protein
MNTILAELLADTTGAFGPAGFPTLATALPAARAKANLSN